jgi:hypothetical protein
MSGQLTLGPDGRVQLFMGEQPSGLDVSRSHQAGSPSRRMSRLRNQVSKSGEQVSKSGEQVGRYVARYDVGMRRTWAGGAS